MSYQGCHSEERSYGYMTLPCRGTQGRKVLDSTGDGPGQGHSGLKRC